MEDEIGLGMMVTFEMRTEGKERQIGNKREREREKDEKGEKRRKTGSQMKTNRTANQMKVK
jgi:siroheme synthase (precorrin-2 oxidase/ferrochelatase)